jgi:hypothetical protein
MLGLEETAPDSWTLSTLTLTNGNPLQTRIYSMGRDEQGELYVGTNTTLAPSQPDPGTGLPAGGLYQVVAAVAGTASVEPVKDNTMFSEFPGNSNGQGAMFAGRTAQGNLRRALLAFDPAPALPAGASVSSASLVLTMDKTVSGASNFTLHRVTEGWGEGSSAAGDPGGAGTQAQPDDATWTHRFFNTVQWTTAGGSFVATPSATASVDGVGRYSWSGPGLVNDLNAWLAAPAGNFGWVLVGNEAAVSAKRFRSRETPVAGQRPALVIGYLAAPALTRREQWLRQYFLTGQFVPDDADPDGDGIGNQIEYALAYSPLAASPRPLAVVRDVDASRFLMTFRRDPRATDLTYRLQTSGDLVAWSTILESAGGAAPAGTALVSDTEIAPEPPLRLVTAQEPLAPGGSRFARLVIIRQP